MKNKHFAIAYANSDGRPFATGVPYILDESETEGEARIRKRQMIAEGFRDVRLFLLPDDETTQPEEIDDRYVSQNLV